MADQFLGEIRIFAGNFAPTGWALCQGQLLPISQNTALFSLLGTYYGGDGKSTFALPNLSDRVPLHQGRGPGLTERVLGETGGAATVTLTPAQMPRHTHTVMAASASSLTTPDTTAALAPVADGTPAYHADTGSRDPMAGSSVLTTGGGQPHNNLPPVLKLSFIIALQGIYPQRP